MPILCQTRDSCRAFPQLAWPVVPASMELTGQGCQGPLFKGRNQGSERGQQPARGHRHAGSWPRLPALLKSGAPARSCWEPQEGPQKPRKQRAA